MVPGIAVPPSNHGIIPSGHWTEAMDSAVARTSCADKIPGSSGILPRPRLYRCSSVLCPDIETCAADRVDLKGLVGCGHAGFLAYTTKLLPVRGFSIRSAVRVTQGALVMSRTSIRWYAFRTWSSRFGPTAHRSHQ